ncbi:MAG TPA: hypothetical protein VF553_23200 [Pyrinomonadaceae bacterium]|jgi:hypothetical protein
MSTHSHPLTHLPTLAARPDSRSLDLVFLLDTICSDETLDERRKYVRNIIRNVSQDFPAEGHLRVGVIPYGPHHSAKMSFAKLSTETARIQKFLRAQSAHPGGPFEAAYEEALYGLYNLDWSRASHRVMVTVGHRPPHPYKPFSYREGDPFDCLGQQFCEKNLDWRLLLAPLRSHLRLRSIAVVCESNWTGQSSLTYTDEYANFCWAEIGYTNLLNFDMTTAGEVARDILKLI